LVTGLRELWRICHNSVPPRHHDVGRAAESSGWVPRLDAGGAVGLLRWSWADIAGTSASVGIVVRSSQ
jgi:hypothetical protein